MKETISKLLHLNIEEKALPDLDILPLYLKGGYDIKVYSIAEADVLFIRPRQQITITALDKQRQQLQRLTGLRCVVYGDIYTHYRRERMIELGIPFFYGKDNMYLPFLGVMLGKNKSFQLPEVNKFSASTQKMILTAIYEHWCEVSTLEISERMGMSRATAARCLTELQALDIPVVELRGKTKYYIFEGTGRQLYEMCRTFLQNPIHKSYRLAHIPDEMSCQGGLSAVSRYSMLVDDEYPTFAVTREEFRELEITKYGVLPRTEKPACIVHVLKYKIEKEGLIDPISAVLCLPEQVKDDPRIESAVEEILEAVWNDKRNKCV